MSWTILKWLLFYGLLAWFLFFIFQRQLIYLPNRQQAHLNHFDQGHIKLLRWKNPSGINLYGFYLPPLSKHPTIIFFHGNAGHIGARKTLMYLLHEKGYGVFMPEYRGYGGIDGHPSEFGLYEDAYSAIRFLCAQHIKEQDIILMGESLGTGVAIEMALRFKIKALILQSAFLNLATMRILHYPYVKVPLLDKYENQEKIKQLVMPILFLHGYLDKIVPVFHGEKLYEQASKSKQRTIKIFNNAAHDLLWNEEYIDAIDHFIKTNAKPI